jgi:hypothetical protein
MQVWTILSGIITSTRDANGNLSGIHSFIKA